MADESKPDQSASSDSKQRHISRNRNWQGEWPRTPGRLLGTGLIRAYQLTFSSIIGHGCRHFPTCSEYGYEAIARFGLIKGGWMTALRVAKCAPWGTSGHDPVIPIKKKPDEK
jgi:putative membrane protein insertion efficiency factor